MSNKKNLRQITVGENAAIREDTKHKLKEKKEKERPNPYKESITKLKEITTPSTQ